MDPRSPQYNNLTRFIAYLDTLHDFCGGRNKLITRNDILHYTREAFGYKKIESIIRDVVYNVSEPLRSSLADQMSQLYNYQNGSFSTFEQNMFDFVMKLDKYFKGGLENVIEIDVKKMMLDHRLKNISMNHIIYDTSALSYDYICNILEKQITVTMATNWDGDGNNTNVSQQCRDDKLTLEFGLDKSKNELSSFDKVSVVNDKIAASLGGKTTYLSWNEIQQELNNTLNVRTYSMHMKSPKSMIARFKNFLQIPDTMTKIHADIVGRVTDVKRSGDWLQLQAIEPLKSVYNYRDMVLYTVDTPLAARCLLKKQIAIVTKKNKGKDTVNVRIVGDVQQNKTIMQSKLKEAADYESTMKSSWIVSGNSIDDMLRQLAELIISLFRRGWNNVQIHGLDSNKLKSDLGYSVMPVDLLLKQKQNEALSFLLYMYLTLHHINSNMAKFEKEWRAKFATTEKRNRQREPSASESSGKKRIRQIEPSALESTAKKRRDISGGMGQEDFITLLQRTQAMKSFFTDDMRMKSIDNKQLLIFENLKKDIEALVKYVNALPDSFVLEDADMPSMKSEELQAMGKKRDLFRAIMRKGSINDNCPMATAVYGMMKDIHDLKDLIQYRGRARNISFNYGSTESDYDRFVSVVNDTYTNTIHFIESISSFDKKDVAKYYAAGFPKPAIGTINQFAVGVLRAQEGGAPERAHLNFQRGIITASADNLEMESPLIRAFFHHDDYISRQTGKYHIPIIDYYIAILIRDMLFERFKRICTDSSFPCPHVPPAARSRGRVRSAPTGRSSVERPMVAAPLSASFDERRSKHAATRAKH